MLDVADSGVKSRLEFSDDKGPFLYDYGTCYQGTQLVITIEITGLTMHCERDYHTCGSFWDYICGYNDVNSFLQWTVCHWTLSEFSCDHSLPGDVD